MGNKNTVNTSITTQHTSYRYHRDLFTTFGFIRRCQKLLPNHIAFYNIPKGIYDISFEYYHIGNIFNEEYDSTRGLKFNINGRSVEKDTGSLFATAIFDNEITSDMCNQYDVHIKWTHKVTDFYMGYINISTKEWITKGLSKHSIGSYTNAEYSVGCHVYVGCNDFMIYNKDHPQGHCSSCVDGNFDEGDIFIMSFNFKKDTFVIYWNGKKAHSMSLNGAKMVIPAFSLYRRGEEIEILKTEFSK
eukprot:265836_1